MKEHMFTERLLDLRLIFAYNKERRDMREKKYEELTITDDFMFSKVMRNSDLCKQFLEYVLDIKIASIAYPDYQKVIDISVDAKSVRLDIYVEDEAHTVYNVEMQSVRKKHLPKRSRYYQGMIDLNLIEKGEHYESLKKSFVIFICTFDPFEQGRHRYTFQNLCLEDRNLQLEDETVKVFINTKGSMGDVSEELKQIFAYFNGQEAVGDYAEKLREEVDRVKKNKEWRLEYMTLQMREMEKYEEGLEKGIEKGIRLTKSVIRLDAEGYAVSDIATELQISEEEVKRILEE